MENKEIMEKLRKDYEYASSLYSENQIVGVFLQGNQNYGVSPDSSNIYSVCILAPSLEDLYFDRTAIYDTCHYAGCISYKDIRPLFRNFKRKNFNLAEILFTEYKIINPLYEEIWNRLIQDIEMAARYDPHRVILDAEYIASWKYNILENRHHGKAGLIDKFGGYNPEQLCDLIKIHNFVYKYSHGNSYSESLKLEPEKADYLKNIKEHGVEGGLEEARKLAEKYYKEIKGILRTICTNKKYAKKLELYELLDSVQMQIVKKYIELELNTTK